MLSDEAQPAGSDGPSDTAAGRPRHAAARKSLLTKLHVPAGKAVALAAMPSAVLMGMGLTPRLAQADELSGTSRPGPCATQRHDPAPTAPGRTAGPAGPSTGPTAAPKPPATVVPLPALPVPVPSVTAAPTPAVTAAPETAAPLTGSAPTSTPAPAPTTTPSPEPTTTVAGGLLTAPLLGGAGDGTATTAAPASAPAAPASAPAPTASAPTPTASAPAAPRTRPAPAPAPSLTVPLKPPSADGLRGTTSDVTGAVDGVAGAVTKATKDLTGPRPTAPPSPAAGVAAPGPGGAKAHTADPCGPGRPAALADGSGAAHIALLSDTPWVLKASRLTLYGLQYHGIVEVRTHSGRLKRVMKFTATGVDIENLHQIVDGPHGTKTHVRARPGSTSTIRGGVVTMYTESQTGNEFGILPTTYTADSPPLVTLPDVFFTDVTVIQAGQFGGNLHIPGMSVTPGE